MQSPSPPLFMSPEPSFPRHKQSTSSSSANPHHHSNSALDSFTSHHSGTTASMMRPRANSGSYGFTDRPAKRQRRDDNSSRNSPRRDGSSGVPIIDLLEDDSPILTRTTAVPRPVHPFIDLSTPRHDHQVPQGSSRLQPIEIKEEAEEEDDATLPVTTPRVGITLPGISSILGSIPQEQVTPEKPTDKNISFKNMTCVICMDKPTNLTAASCGMYRINMEDT